MINSYNNETKRGYRVLLVVTIFYMAIYNDSLWVNKFNHSIFGYVRYILICLMLVVFLYRLVFLNRSRERLLIVLGLFSFLVYNLLFHNEITFIPIIIFCLYANNLNRREVIQSYALGLILCVLLVVPFSLIGILPIRTDNNLLAYGFSNPNGLGGILSVIFMSYLYLNWRKCKVWFIVLYIGAIYFNYSILVDRTASICMLVFLMCYFIRLHIHNSDVIGLIGMFLPVILTIVSLVLAYMYGKYNWTYEVDHWLTRRVYTWNYYLNTNGVHLIPDKMGLVQANEFEKGFYGKNINVLLTGSFDGGYIYLLIRMGIINTIAIIGLIVNFFNRLRIENDVSLEILLIIFMICAFTENAYIAPYGYSESYLLVICFSYFSIRQITKNNLI